MVKYYNYYCQEWEVYDSIEWWMLDRSKLCFQSMKTTQEKRRYVQDYQEKNYYGYKLRGKRSYRGLPCSWDDKYISCCSTKNWKKLYKVRKQYMKPKIKEIC